MGTTFNDMLLTLLEKAITAGQGLYVNMATGATVDVSDRAARDVGKVDVAALDQYTPEDMDTGAGTVNALPAVLKFAGAGGVTAPGDLANGLDVDVTRLPAVTVASGGIASGAVASGAVASGAVASGAIASGAVASGAIASGAIVDGADVTQGAKDDARSTATDTTAASVVSVLKEISYMEQNPASRAVTGAVTVSGTATVTQAAGTWVAHGGLADNTAAAGNPMAVGALADETVPSAVTQGRLGWLRMTLHRLLRITTSKEPDAPVLHRTVTAMWGQHPPLPTDANWSVNPGQRDEARFLTVLAVRGTTALLDDPQISFRPYIRCGGTGGYVGAAETTTYTRSRLKDLNTIHFLHTHDNGANYTNDDAAVIDNSAATQSDLDALDTLANLDYFVIGGPVPFIGAALDLDAANVNANASILTVEYASHATAGVVDAWTAVANLTDGTIAVEGKTLSGDGQITWDLPAAGAWVAGTLPGAGAPATSCYWIRCSVSAAISANVDVEECDLLMPIEAAIDVAAKGDDVLLTLMSLDNAVTGTIAYSGSVMLSWR